MAALVLEYYLLLRSVLRAKPFLRACLTRCRHCRIFFLTDPRNAGRRDLGCPFGCREAHRKQRPRGAVPPITAIPRAGKRRSDLNQRRPRKDCAPGRPGPAQPRSKPRSAPWNQVMVEHVRMVSSLIEGRWVSRKQILEMLARVLRQHTMCRRRKIDQAVAWLKEHPP